MHNVTTLRRPAQPTTTISYLVDTCRAELEAASHRHRLATRAWDRDRDVELDAAAGRLPHEHAAATLLNVWGHLHPVEARTVQCATKLVAQRTAGWTARAAGTLADLRFYLAERTKLRATFDRAAADYAAARAATDMKVAA